MRYFVPEDWVQQLDFTNAERINAKFHTESLRQRDGDLIFRIPCKEGPEELYLYLLLEFQSTPDKWMALRILVYVGLLYQHLIKEKSLDPQKQLPPIFPLVLYNGDRAWTHDTDLQSLIGLPINSPLLKWQPQIHYSLLDENKYPEGKVGSLTGALFRIENSRNISELKRNIGKLWQDHPEILQHIRKTMVTWIVDVIFPKKGLKLNRKLIEEATEDPQMLCTRVSEWEREIEENGRKEGLKLGSEKTFRKVLSVRFGPLPDWAEEKIQHADEAQIDQWIENLMQADKLEEVFL